MCLLDWNNNYHNNMSVHTHSSGCGTPGMYDSNGHGNGHSGTFFNDSNSSLLHHEWLASFDLLQRTTFNHSSAFGLPPGLFPGSSSPAVSSSMDPVEAMAEEERKHQQRLMILNAFAYEDFYEMVQMFYELDSDQDDHLTKEDLLRYHHCALSSAMIDR
jgi:hypothetical protein